MYWTVSGSPLHFQVVCVLSMYGNSSDQGVWLQIMPMVRFYKTLFWLSFVFYII